MSAVEKRGRIPELDGFRVLLVFIVSWFHIWQQSWLTPYIGATSLDFLVRAGYVLVDGTILLSGFLLFLPHVYSMRDSSPVPSVRDFYRRRVMRIMPSYYFVTLLMLFAVALPHKLYSSGQQMSEDIITHLTFSFTFFKTPYLASQLGGASWTVVIEMQMYLLFPLIARWARKSPAGVICGMMAISAYARTFFLHTMTDYSLVVNQLVSFLDVYAIGMACAILYVYLQEKWETWPRPMLRQLAATAVAVAGLVLVVELIRDQARSGSFDSIQAGQLIRRPFLALELGAVMVALPFCVKPMRWLFGNRMMGFLAGVSMNYYLLHQNVAVELKRLGIPYSASQAPNMDGDVVWQYTYTWLCFGISLALAVAVTYLVEKPCAKLLKKFFSRVDARRAARAAAKAASALSEPPADAPTEP